MKSKISTTFIRRSLIVVLIFNTLSALFGGIGLMCNNALGMPEYFLDNTVFSSYFIPGLILAGVVGGTHLLAAIVVIKRWPLNLFLVVVAAFGMLIWIYGEIYLTLMNSWLQTLYFATGILELILVLGLLGLVPQLVKSGRG